MKTHTETAFSKGVLDILERIASTLGDARLKKPVRGVIAGGVAIHLLTGNRVSEDVDMFFSHRLIVPQDMEIFYQDEEGNKRSVWFDYNYNPYLGVLHPDALNDALPVGWGFGDHPFEVCVLRPHDLAISKLGRFSARDREDIRALIDCGLLADSGQFEERAREALDYYVGDARFIFANMQDVSSWIRDTHETHPAANLSW